MAQRALSEMLSSDPSIFFLCTFSPVQNLPSTAVLMARGPSSHRHVPQTDARLALFEGIRFGSTGGLPFFGLSKRPTPDALYCIISVSSLFLASFHVVHWRMETGWNEWKWKMDETELDTETWGHCAISYQRHMPEVLSKDATGWLSQEHTRRSQWFRVCFFQAWAQNGNTSHDPVARFSSQYTDSARVAS